MAAAAADDEQHQQLSCLVVLHPQPELVDDIGRSVRFYLESLIANDFLDPPRAFPLRIICNRQTTVDIYRHVGDLKQWFNAGGCEFKEDLTRFGRHFFQRCKNQLRAWSGPNPDAEKTSRQRRRELGPKVEWVREGGRHVMVDRAVLVYHPLEGKYVEYTTDNRDWLSAALHSEKDTCVVCQHLIAITCRPFDLSITIFDDAIPDVVYITRYSDLKGCLLRQEPPPQLTVSGAVRHFTALGSIFVQPFTLATSTTPAIAIATASPPPTTTTTAAAAIVGFGTRRYVKGGWTSMDEELGRLVKNCDRIAGVSPVPLGPSLTDEQRLAIHKMQWRRLKPRQTNNNNSSSNSRRKRSNEETLPMPHDERHKWTHHYEVDEELLDVWLSDLDEMNASLLLVLTEPLDQLDAVCHIVAKKRQGDGRLPELSVLFLDVGPQLLLQMNMKVNGLFGGVDGAVAPLVVVVPRSAERKAESSRVAHLELAECSYLYQRHSNLDLEGLYQSVFRNSSSSSSTGGGGGYAQMVQAVRRQVKEADREAHCLMIAGDDTINRLRRLLQTEYPLATDDGSLLHRLVPKAAGVRQPITTIQQWLQPPAPPRGGGDDDDRRDGDDDEDEREGADNNNDDFAPSPTKRRRHHGGGGTSRNAAAAAAPPPRTPPPQSPPMQEITPTKPAAAAAAVRSRRRAPLILSPADPNRISNYYTLGLYKKQNQKKQKMVVAVEQTWIPPIKQQPPLGVTAAATVVMLDEMTDSGMDVMESEEEEEDDDDDDDDGDDDDSQQQQHEKEKETNDEAEDSATEDALEHQEQEEAAIRSVSEKVAPTRPASRLNEFVDLLHDFNLGQQTIKDMEPRVAMNIPVGNIVRSQLREKALYFCDSYRGTVELRTKLHLDAAKYNDRRAELLIDPAWLVDSAEVERYVKEHFYISSKSKGKRAEEEKAAAATATTTLATIPPQPPQKLISRNGDAINCSISDLLSAKLYLQKSSNAVVRRSAQALATFLAFLKSPVGKVVVSATLTQDHQRSIGLHTKQMDDWNFTEWLTALNYIHNRSQRSDRLVQPFDIWYMRLAPCRRQPSKLYGSTYNAAAADVKERCSLDTIVTAITTAYCILALSGAPAVKKSNPGGEWSRWWAAHRLAMNSEGVAAAGPTMKDSLPLHFGDLVTRVEQRGKDINTQYSIYAVLLAFFLAGNGLRPGSVGAYRNGRKRQKARDVMRQQQQNRNVADNNNNNSSPSATDEDDYDDDDEKEEKEEGEKEDDEEVPDDGDVDFDADVLNFGGLRCRHIKVYRMPRRPDDPQEVPCRLSVRVALPMDKIGGLRTRAISGITLWWPRRTHDGSYDWSFNDCIAVCLLAVLMGHVEPEDLWAAEKEPSNRASLLISGLYHYKPNRPFFCAPPVMSSRSSFIGKANPLRHVNVVIQKAFETLALPVNTFTPKSFRIGYVQTLVKNIMMIQPCEALMTKEDIRRLVFTGNRWRSSQVECYLRHMYNSMPKEADSDTVTTAADFLTAFYRSTAAARFKAYSYRTLPQFLDERQQTLQTKGLEETLTINSLRIGFNLINSASYMSAQIEEKSITEIRQLYDAGNRRRLDLISTVKHFCHLIHEPAFHVLCGNIFDDGLPEGHTHYVCPVVGCSKQFRRAVSANEHWLVQHRGLGPGNVEVQYVCPVCVSSSPMKYRSIVRHFNKNHKAKRNILRPDGFRLFYVTPEERQEQEVVEELIAVDPTTAA